MVMEFEFGGTAAVETTANTVVLEFGGCETTANTVVLEFGGCETNKFFGVKLLSKRIAGRIVLSHVHVSPFRRMRSTQKLSSTGLASGGIITLE